MASQGGVPLEGNFDLKVPRLHEEEGRRGGIGHTGDPEAKGCCGVFQPKLMDLIGDSSSMALNNLFNPVDWFSIIGTSGFKTYGCWLGR